MQKQFDTPELQKLFADNFIQKLLKQDMRYSDRDNSEALLTYDNFGDYYAEQKQLFTVGFSKPEMLINSVIVGYLLAQMHMLINEGAPIADGKEAGVARLREMFTKLVKADFRALDAVLRDKWPKEHADILERNEKFKIKSPA